MSIQTPLFESTDVILSSIDHETDPEVEAQWTAEPTYARMISIEPMRPMSAFQIKKKYDSIEKRFEEDKDIYHYQVRLIQTQRLVGFGQISDISWTHRAAQINLGIGLPEDRRKGYGIQTLGLLVNYGFYELNLRRLSAVIPSYNVPAVSLFERFGFVQEVCRREALQKDGKYWDHLVFSYTKRGHYER